MNDYNACNGKACLKYARHLVKGERNFDSLCGFLVAHHSTKYGFNQANHAQDSKQTNSNEAGALNVIIDVAQENKPNTRANSN